MSRELPSPQFLSFKEIAAIYGVSTSFVRRLAERGELPVTRVGRNLRADVTDVYSVLPRPKSLDSN